MKIVRIIAFLTVGVSLSACAAVDAVSRNASLQEIADDPTEAVAAPATSLASTEARVEEAVRINDVFITVPTTLRVSEANLYFPPGDIVWRGDPRGDRHEQVKAIFETAMSRGAKRIEGQRRVDLLINVKRFHALTEKARYTIGGVHHIVFDLALADPVTGDIVEPWREVRADLKAFGGQDAVEAEARGETQKVRITEHLAQVLQEEISTPEGHKNANLGLVQLMHEM